MAFVSLRFVLFFATFFFLYWVVFKKNTKHQNALILIANYFFFAWWDWRFLVILMGSSILNFFLGIQIGKTQSDIRKSQLVFFGVLQGLGMLLFFKYYNFFAASLVHFFNLFSFHISLTTLNLILPLGISFYTFRAISYLIDIKNELIKPTKRWVVFFAYLSFFPTILAGPIDRARTFIPQLEGKRIFNYTEFNNGLRQILWGLFKKAVIADNCSLITAQIFNNDQMLPGSSLAIGAFLFTLQVYADFSGYSDMAIGMGHLLGFKIIRNFNYPFFALNIAVFWQRWHISLTSWMTEYVFTPLSFIYRKYRKKGLILAIIINFVLVGLWHGANWKFVVFGLLNGLYFIPLILKGGLNNQKTAEANKFLPSFKEFGAMAGTFFLVMVTNIIFMADNISLAASYYRRLFSASFFSLPIFRNEASVVTMVVFCLATLSIEWSNRDKEHPLYYLPTKVDYKIYLRLSLVYIIVWTVLIWGAFGNKTFIYTKF